MRNTWLTFVAWVAPVAGVLADPAPPPQPPARPPAEASRPGEGWSFGFTQWTVFDSNINHEPVPTRDVGFVMGAEVAWKGRLNRSRLQFSYDLAGHRYRTTDEWDRTSHHLLASFEPRWPRWLAPETVGEVSLKGSSEDRELGDQYQLLQRFEPRLTRSTAIRLDGAVRLKRYADDAQRNATNRYLEAELRQRLGGARLALGTRRERNDAVGARNDYGRITHHASLVLPTGSGDELELEVKYRSQRYPERLVEVNDEDVPREDRRLIPSASWTFGLSSALLVRMEYKFERRTSNDPEKDFVAHQAALGFTVRW